MIPVDMPVMLLGYIIYIFSEVFLWLFIAGLIALLIPRSRRYIVARRWRFGVAWNSRRAMVSRRSRPCRPITWQDGNVSLVRSSSIFRSVLISSFPNGR